MTDGPDKPWLIPLLLAAGAVAALAWFLLSMDRQEPEPAAAEPPAEGAAARPRPGPIYPLEPPAAEDAEARELEPLPPLSDSDAWFRRELGEIFGSQLGDLLADRELIEKFVATIDNLPRTHVAERLRPVGQAPGAFAVSPGDGDSFVVDAANAGRYAPFVEMLAVADVDQLVDAYRRYYPLLQEAYVALGYPDGYFNDRLVEVIDHLLATPAVEVPIVLVRPHVLYEYADPDLEALSAGQKLMLRIGRENSERVRDVLAAFRERIAATN